MTCQPSPEPPLLSRDLLEEMARHLPPDVCRGLDDSEARLLRAESRALRRNLSDVATCWEAAERDNAELREDLAQCDQEIARLGAVLARLRKLYRRYTGGLDRSYFPLSVDAVCRLYFKYRKRPEHELLMFGQEIEGAQRRLPSLKENDYDH